ncbi:MAG: MotA/TolQ/ExbB proton channel family protein [Saprospiraceae bacterium]|nr:MotA/TolQ/ExbB proton channel family protein [Saprospiraceae bacterium]
MANAPKKNEKGTGIAGILPFIVIPIAFLLGYLLYKFVFGDPSHFKDGNPDLDPLPGDYLGVIYKGGFIVPILLGLLFITIIFSIERLFTIIKAAGVGSVDKFVRNVQYSLANGDIKTAIAACDKQKGSVANVIRSGLTTYGMVSNATDMDREQKVAAIQKELEESTSLELPSLEQNLPIIATIATIATLVGLIGTVLGMIRAFAGMAHSGAPDASALATGISEALINTALGITTSAIAIVSYSYFTTRIDGMTYRIDEAGYSMQQQFVAQSK